MVTITLSPDSAARLVFALEALHGATSDALRARYTDRGNDNACELLRVELLAIEAQIIVHKLVNAKVGV